jgi:arylsulfatase A-like enzyme
MLTGQDIWRLEEGANLWGILPAKFQVYTDLLEDAGYIVGFQGKGWGPGNFEAGGRARNPAGNAYETFEAFFQDREEGQAFSYWFSSRNPHRPFEQDSIAASIPLDAIEVPPYLPDNDTVKGDIRDYYAEVEDFDQQVGSFIRLLEEKGELENTMIVVCSDNGWQMPRGLANLYTFGTQIPLIFSMPSSLASGGVVDELVSLNDLAPTFLELAEIEIPREMTAKSLLPLLLPDEKAETFRRDFIVTARERHAYVREGGKGYGGRAITTKDYLYIKNFDPGYWPAGDPPLYGDVDAHMLHYPSPTKVYMLKHKEKPGVSELFDLAFAKRPEEELYDLQKDPYQLKNVAYEEEYAEKKAELSAQLNQYLTDTQDPRLIGGEMKWLDGAYFAEQDKNPRPSPSMQEELNLEAEYQY